MVCNEFAVAYKRENAQAQIIHGKTERGDEHTYIYDPEQDRTLDATLSQFAPYNAVKYQDDWWPGDDHPHVDEIARYDDILEFVAKTGGRAALTEEERTQLEG